MGRNKQLRKRIRGVERVLRAHQAKLARERAKPVPDPEAVSFWQKEIEGYRKQVDDMASKLPGDGGP